MANKIKKQTTREILIEAIFEYAFDEFTVMGDAQQIAGESKKELVDRIISILEWYKNECNEK